MIRERSRRLVESASPRVRRATKFAAVSVVAIAISQSVLALAFGVFNWSARPANLLSCAVATGPAFELNRRWTWRRAGKSHLRNEVLPFWVMAFVGLAASTWSAWVAEGVAHDVTDSRLAQTVIVMVGALSSYGVLWIAKFLVLDHFVFPSERTDA